MAIYKIFPTKDASIYTEYSDMNTGLDQILEASTYIKSGKAQVSRYLCQFSDSEISDVLTNKVSGSNFVAYFRNYVALLTGLNLDNKL